MTLNTFHNAGISSKNVTLGAPRLKELINVNKNIKTPSVTIYLKPEYACSKDKAFEVQHLLEYTTLRDVCELSEIYYDPIDHENGRYSVITEDNDFLHIDYDLIDEEQVGNMDEFFNKKLSPWVLRLQLASK